MALTLNLPFFGRSILR